MSEAEEPYLDTAADLVTQREEGHGVRLGVSEITYSQLAAASVAHAKRAPVAADPTWATIGPRNVGGRITAFAQDDSNPLVLYAGSAHGGLWVSRDAGDTWAHVGKPEDNFPIGTIAIVPGDPTTVIVGTGSMTARYVAGLGLFRVTVPVDPSAAAYVNLAPAPGLSALPGDASLKAGALRYTRIRFDPGNPKRFWVAAQTGLWRFEPTGGVGFTRDFPVGADDPSGAPAFETNLQFLATWPDYCTDLLLARDPRDDDKETEEGVEGARYLILYAGVSVAGVFRGRFDRRDKKMKWDSKLDVPSEDLYSGGRAFTRVRLSRCEDHPNVVYAVFSPNPGPDPAPPPPLTFQNLQEQDHASFVFRSDDNGKNWSKRGRIPRAIGYTDTLPVTRDGQADYSLLMEADPSNPDVLVCGEIDVCRSVDGARTWVTILDWTNYDNGDYAQHADQHIALFDRSDHRKVWIGNDGGLSLARNLKLEPGSDRFWRKRSHGIIAAQFFDVTVHPNPAFNFMCGGGLQDNGSYASVGGATWIHVGWADGGALAFHATIPEFMLVGQDNLMNLATVEAAPFRAGSRGVTNPILADLPLTDRRSFIRINQLRIASFGATGPFNFPLEQDPITPGRSLAGWTASPTDAIAYLVAPPPALPLPSPLPLPQATPLNGMTSAGVVVAAGEDVQAIEFGPVIPVVPNRATAWLGTSRGQLLFALNGTLAAGWAPAPTVLPLVGGVPRLVSSIAVHPSDEWVVLVSSVPNVRGLPATTLAALASDIVLAITTAGAVATARFTFAIGALPASAPVLTAASVPLNGTLTVVFFTPGAFVVGNKWTIKPDGTVTADAANTSAGGVAATTITGGRVFLTYDRGTTWTDVSAPAAPLPRPNPDLLAISPGPVASVEFDRSVPNPTRVFAGTLGGVYVLPNVPLPTGVTLAVKPANIPLTTTIQLQANCAMTSGPPLDCTRAAEWSTSNPAALAVSATGLVSITPVTGVVGGSSTITVRRGTFTDTVLITIRAAAVVPAPAAPGVFVPPTVPIAWRPFGKTLPLVLVNDLIIVPGTTRLRAATFGRGIWDADLAATAQHQLFIRQTVIDDGRTTQRVVPNVGPLPGTPLMDPRLPQTGPTRFAIDFVHGYDIRVDAAPLSFFDDVVDGVEFDEQIGVDDAVPFETNFVYVQVSSKGVAVTETVDVHLFARLSPVPAPHGVAPVAMPALGNVSDVYPPTDPTKPVAPWTRIGTSAVTIKKVGPGQPVVARFTWVPDATFADKDVALLAMCTTPNADDPLPTPAIDTASLAAFITKERRASLRIVHVAPQPVASLYIRDGIADDTRVGGYPAGGRSPDIIVVHPDIAGPAKDAFKDFMSRRPTDTITGTGTNVIYVRVHNRRRFATNAKVKLFAIDLNDNNAPNNTPALWTELPVGLPFADVPAIPPLGVGYARIEFPGATEPNVVGTNKTYLLLALIKSEDDKDALPNKDRVDSADTFWDLVSRFVDSDNAAARAVPFVP